MPSGGGLIPYPPLLATSTRPGPPPLDGEVCQATRVTFTALSRQTAVRLAEAFKGLALLAFAWSTVTAAAHLHSMVNAQDTTRETAAHSFVQACAQRRTVDPHVFADHLHTTVIALVNSIIPDLLTKINAHQLRTAAIHPNTDADAACINSDAGATAAAIDMVREAASGGAWDLGRGTGVQQLTSVCDYATQVYESAIIEAAARLLDKVQMDHATRCSTAASAAATASAIMAGLAAAGAGGGPSRTHPHQQARQQLPPLPPAPASRNGAAPARAAPAPRPQPTEPDWTEPLRAAEGRRRPGHPNPSPLPREQAQICMRYARGGCPNQQCQHVHIDSISRPVRLADLQHLVASRGWEVVSTDPTKLS